jgi:RNA polymerase sigma-70 factor (ECF subfamily)
MDEDVKLVERLRAGDPFVLETFMSQHARRVYRLAYGIVRNEADAEEVTQDVFLSICRKLETFEGRSALTSWIHRITINTALNKRRGKRQELETSLDAQLPTFKEDGHREGERAFVLADWSSTPDAELLSAETRRLLDRAIGDLPDASRAVLIMRDVEGLSNEEVAQALGESIASVKSRLHRARMAVREQLTRHFAPPV